MFEILKKSPYYITDEEYQKIDKVRRFTFADQNAYYFLFIPYYFENNRPKPVEWIVEQSNHPFLNIYEQPPWFKELYHQGIECYYDSQRLRFKLLGIKRNLHSIIYSYSVFWNEKIETKLTNNLYCFSSSRENIPFHREYFPYLCFLKNKFEKEGYIISMTDINDDGYFHISLK